MKDKQIPEEELFVELDSMYQRVADIEKEEAAETLIPEKKKPKQKKKRSYRYFIIVASISFIILASIFTLTILKPTIIPQLFKIGDTKPSTVVTPPARPKLPKVATPPAPSKSPSAVATAPTTSAPPAVAPSPEPAKPPAVVTPLEPPTSPAVATSPATSPTPSVAPSPEPTKTPAEPLSAQTKQETAKTAQEEVKKEKAISQEITKPSRPLPQGRYYAIQVGAFSDMEYVRELVEALKKDGLEAYWLTMKSRSRGTLYRVFVGQFMNENEAAQFLKDKKILKNYPDSFIKEVSSSKMNP
jgi:cytoskeletal protein RodZ